MRENERMKTKKRVGIKKSKIGKKWMKKARNEDVQWRE